MTKGENMGSYRGWSIPKDDGCSDDRYDAMKDAYAEGWGRPYNERTRREVQNEIDNDREQGWR
jgi:hypothetical protein